MDSLNDIFSKLSIIEKDDVTVEQIDEITNDICKINISELEIPIQNILINILHILSTKRSCSNHIHMKIHEPPDCF
jgi:hypothetical protein